ncbi:nineteen complex-related protein 2-domain-containing protein [Schizothecium vesticola]|uniref:Nineteen complex-related protein 2-domain-containing protein n=1 Tax=Schizothecium vesticola TaxID=314040 RepID=A0AA40EU45_9PEZI|nr:nineteen complex-related protein 2-domain-containing protein [Schizothecium vesticola]
MSAFTKRKARIIQTLDDDDVESGPALTPPRTLERTSEQADALSTVTVPSGVPLKFGRSKPVKSSSLRKSINFNDDHDTTGGGASIHSESGANSTNDGEDEGGAPVVVRPALSRSSSTRPKKRSSTARLSFGPGESLSNEGDDAAAAEVVTPKKTLGHKALHNNALRKSASFQNLQLNNLPTRFGTFGNEEERPQYSKEYLKELQSSTPNTPAKLPSQIDNDLMDLDPSELEGALIVPSQDLAPLSPSAQALTTRDTRPAGAHILSETEIRERKERRARLAHEADYISLDDAGSESDPERHRVTKHKKSESRLIAEDEDLGEGYDEFVSDGGLALGRRAERDAARRHRQEIAELIQAAEDDNSSDDDSEAERRAAYEAAQRRAGMDGLHRDEDDDLDMDGTGGGGGAIPRMKPLPELDEVLQRMRGLVQGLRDEVAGKEARRAALKREKEEILAREKEVQEILNQAGAKYQALVGSAGGRDVSKLVTQSPMRPLPPGIVGDVPMERGLESFGTPTRKPNEEEDML